jgi:hypothetical protein
MGNWVMTGYRGITPVITQYNYQNIALSFSELLWVANGGANVRDLTLSLRLLVRHLQ